jgi:hypothetical protein
VVVEQEDEDKVKISKATESASAPRAALNPHAVPDLHPECNMWELPFLGYLYDMSSSLYELWESLPCLINGQGNE